MEYFVLRVQLYRVFQEHDIFLCFRLLFKGGTGKFQWDTHPILIPEFPNKFS